MRFQVPQFIEHEAKVIGPLTFRQFIYIGIPAAVAFFLYFLVTFFVFIVAAVFLGVLGFMFAFIKIGGRSLPSILLNFFNFSIAPKRYIWRKGQAPLPTSVGVGIASHLGKVAGEQSSQETPRREIKLVQKSKIKDLATRVETNR